MSPQDNVQPEPDLSQFAQFDLKKRTVLESLAHGSSVTAATQAADVARRTFYDWIESDPKFARAVMLMEEAATNVIEDALWLHARAGNAQLIKYYLSNRRPERWKNTTKVEMTGENGGPIRTVTATELTDDQLARIASQQ